ncbi:hypothetical protein JCM14076_24200 [Methylosoma difficile]
MLNAKPFRLLLVAALIGNLSACGYIRSLFPNKEKDYQYTVEIPPLVYPKDLAKNDRLPARINAAPQQPEPVVAAPAPVAEATPAEPVLSEPLPESVPATASKPAVKRSPLNVNVVANGDNSLLRMDANFDAAWRSINKALSRKSIEVTARNQAEKSISLRFDASKQAAPTPSNSFWDEALFIFSGLPNSENAYTLKFTETGTQTDMVVLDEDQEAVTDEDSLKLLNLLQDTIRADFAK